MRQEEALAPRNERIVDSYWDKITVALVGEDDLYVPLRSLCQGRGGLGSGAKLVMEG